MYIKGCYAIIVCVMLCICSMHAMSCADTAASQSPRESVPDSAVQITLPPVAKYALGVFDKSRRDFFKSRIIKQLEQFHYCQQFVQSQTDKTESVLSDACPEISGIYCFLGGKMTSSDPQGQPGDYIVIMGSDLDKPEVHFAVSEGVDKASQIVSPPTPGSITCRVPDVSGISEDYVGAVYVICGDKKSESIKFIVHPAMDLQLMEIRREVLPDDKGEMEIAGSAHGDSWAPYITKIDKDGNQLSQLMKVHHVRNTSTKTTGDDAFFQKKKLKNNWKVQYIDVNVLSDRRHGGASLKESRRHSDSPLARIGWGTDVGQELEYLIAWYISGHVGTAYQ